MKDNYTNLRKANETLCKCENGEKISFLESLKSDIVLRKKENNKKKGKEKREI